MALLDRYAGPYDPGFRLEQLDGAALARLGRETMLLAHLHDRALMPLLGARFGPEAMTEVACDEWMGSSPIYNQRNREGLAIPGDGVSAILKTLQLDVGFPHQYMDVHYELVDESLGYFWLPFCGAYQDVLRFSGGREDAIVQLCHHMEDPTFDATVMAVNPRARCRPEHRPPLADDHLGPTCRWRVFLGEEEGAVQEIAITARVRKSRAARFELSSPPGGEDDGLSDYAGPLRPDFALEDLARPVLARQCREFALDVHLLTRAAFESVAGRFGEEAAREIASEERAALAAIALPRLGAALGIEGDDAHAILKTLQTDPALPGEYLCTGGVVIDERRARFWIEPCDALAPGEPVAWLGGLAGGEPEALESVVAAVQPRARCRSLDPASVGEAEAVRAWEIAIDPAAEPRPEPRAARAIRASNAPGFRFRGRPRG